MMWIDFSVFRFRWVFRSMSSTWIFNSCNLIYLWFACVGQTGRLLWENFNQKPCAKFIFTHRHNYSKPYTQVSKKSIFRKFSHSKCIYKIQSAFFHATDPSERKTCLTGAMCVHCACNIKSIFTKPKPYHTLTLSLTHSITHIQREYVKFQNFHVV